jgi:uncharacterized protein (DUF1501 family)
MDGLSVVMPVGDASFRSVRGQLADPAQGTPVKLDAMFALHPALAGTADMYAKGEALFVHAIASPYRERSHFDGQNVLETGGTAAYALSDGWLNRALPLMPHAREAVAITATVPMALRGKAPVTSYAPSALPPASDDLLSRVAGLYSGDPQLHALWSQAMDARTMAGADADKKSNPATLGKLAATFLSKPDGPRIAVIELQGWDTHAQQNGRLNTQLKELDTLLVALKTGLGPDWSKTVVLAATEFGRTAAVNGTGGTDHGTGGAAILAGGALKGGRVVADWPGLRGSDLYENRDLKPTMDLRAVMVGVLAGQFGIDPGRMGTVFPNAAALRPVEGLVRI